MSVTNEPVLKKKRGRPKKAEAAIAKAPEVLDTKEVARKAVEEILSQAAVVAGVDKGLQSVSPVSIEGAKTGASSHDNLEHAQADYIPGTRVSDIQQVPSRIYDEETDGVRQVGLPDSYAYCWVHPEKITTYRLSGYRFCIYNGGPGSGLADRGFQGTGVFEKTFDMHVRNGDMFLMYVDRRLHERFEKEDIAMRERHEGSAEGQVHNDGYRRGIRTFKEVNGVTLYN